MSEDEWIGDIEEAEVKMPKEQSQGDEFEFAHEVSSAGVEEPSLTVFIISAPLEESEGKTATER